ncbi:MAG: hypothetical protein AB1473_08890 [Thermodesulfobacteriota bacterium]
MESTGKAVTIRNLPGAGAGGTHDEHWHRSPAAPAAMHSSSGDSFEWRAIGSW